MKKKLDLSGYSKSDLAFIIEYMVERNGSYYFNVAVNQLQYRREMKRIEEEDKVLDAAIDKRRQASELLAPYKETGFSQIPLEVMRKAAALMSEAQALDKKWQAMIRRNSP